MRTRRPAAWAVLVVFALTVTGCSSSSGSPTQRASDRPEASPTGTIQLVTPEALGGRPKSMDRTLIGYAHQSMAELKKEFAAPTSAVGWAYGGESETDEIILISGASGTLPDPKGALERLLASLPRLKNVRPVDPGPLGGEASCGSGETTNAGGIVGVTSCAWVDAGSIGLVTFMSPGRSSTGRDRSAEFVTIRGQIQQRTS